MRHDGTSVACTRTSISIWQLSGVSDGLTRSAQATLTKPGSPNDAKSWLVGDVHEWNPQPPHLANRAHDQLARWIVGEDLEPWPVLRGVKIVDSNRRR